mmetsp:Transcript_15444/g.50409  ORF Transcript_15444/g.50409 Transcript_15444/m.50409 type:complete len:253 (-) Transcript_15444:1235-1993(-)
MIESSTSRSSISKMRWCRSDSWILPSASGSSCSSTCWICFASGLRFSFMASMACISSSRDSTPSPSTSSDWKEAPTEPSTSSTSDRRDSIIRRTRESSMRTWYVCSFAASMDVAAERRSASSADMSFRSSSSADCAESVPTACAISRTCSRESRSTTSVSTASADVWPSTDGGGGTAWAGGTAAESFGCGGAGCTSRFSANLFLSSRSSSTSIRSRSSEASASLGESSFLVSAMAESMIFSEMDESAVRAAL